MYNATIRGVTIHYDRMGSRGEPLILIHGLGERKEGWEYQHALADTYDLIIPDLRGHGRSENAEGISIEHFAKDILALMDHLGVESAHLCGLSMGGIVAQEIYRQAPERCRSLILVSTYYFVPELWAGLLYNLYTRRLNALPKAVRMRLAAYSCLYSRDEAIVRRFRRAIGPEEKSYKASVAACVKVDNRRLLPKIKVPTLIIGCAYDLITPVWIQALMHKLIPNSELVILRNAGHMAKLEKPGEFNRVLREFLDRQRLPANG